MTTRTLCFLLRDGRALLAYKKLGFGAGKYGGAGGKVEVGETPAQAAVRELAEETGVHVREQDLRRMARLTFLFPARPSWSQVVHVFVTGTWCGRPSESREIRPAWFDLHDLPLDRMWQDARYWLPDVLAGRPVRMRFVYGPDNETIREMQREDWPGDEE